MPTPLLVQVIYDLPLDILWWFFDMEARLEWWAIILKITVKICWSLRTLIRQASSVKSKKLTILFFLNGDRLKLDRQVEYVVLVRATTHLYLWFTGLFTEAFRKVLTIMGFWKTTAWEEDQALRFGWVDGAAPGSWRLAHEPDCEAPGHLDGGCQPVHVWHANWRPSF